MELDKIKSIVESLLFVSGEPIKLSRLAKIIGVKMAEVEKAVMVLQKEYSQNRGLIIIKKEKSVQMATNPENAESVSQIAKNELQGNLSQSSLEVLSIVAYRGPISRANVEAIRGVNCSFTLRTLMMRGMLERYDDPQNARSYLYKISFGFLKKFGIDRVEKLPDWETLSKNSQIDDVINLKT